jgi:hypothetical protein
MPPLLELGTDPPRLEEVPVLEALSTLFALELLEPVLAPPVLVWLLKLFFNVLLLRLLSSLFRPSWLLRELPTDSVSAPSALVLLLFEEDLVPKAATAAALNLPLELLLCWAGLASL